MKYINGNNKITLFNKEDFNIKQILECGQIFRFKIHENYAVVNSIDKQAKITTFDDRIEIETEDVDYFEHFFDLKTDYSRIKYELMQDKVLLPAVNYGHGIRILNNDTYEMLISFIISANNNIKRIKNSIEYLCEHFGSNLGSYFAFPTLKQLKNASVDDFKKAGLGYRAEQMFSTVQGLSDEQIQMLKQKNKDEQFKFLTSLKGIGEKVANCIMLFGLGVKDVFPVDTWINKVYNNINKTQETDRKKITKELSEKYGNLSGYAQQYFFYYYRENKIKN